MNGRNFPRQGAFRPISAKVESEVRGQVAALSRLDVRPPIQLTRLAGIPILSIDKTVYLRRATVSVGGITAFSGSTLGTGSVTYQVATAGVLAAGDTGTVSSWATSSIPAGTNVYIAIVDGSPEIVGQLC